MRASGPVVTEQSAGGVILVRYGPELLVALIRPRGGDVLALPKGHIEPGESPEQAAVRETREETGLAGTLLAPLEEISYMFWSRARGARILKRVRFYVLAYLAGSITRHDREVEGVRLVPAARAVAALSYPGERRVMEAGLAWIRAAGYGGAGAKDGA